jgi:uncharacterized iron-regulated membrane protein
MMRSSGGRRQLLPVLGRKGERPVSSWQQWVRQPQRVWLRRALFQVHLWTGLILGLYILMLSVTGSVLVYRVELDRSLGAPRPAFDPARPMLSKEEMRSAALRAYPGWEIVSQSERVTRRDPTIRVALERDGAQVHRVFNPYTGEDLGDFYTRGQQAVETLVSLHDDLLFDRDGRWWNGVGSAFATLLVLTGLVVWWPGVSRWKRSLGVRRSQGWRRFNWDLHSAVGIWTFAFLLIWGVSGSYLGVPEPFTWLVDATAFEAPGEERLGDTILAWLARLHFGRWRTPWLKAAWAVVGLAPAIMFVTGTVMWWNRVVRPKLRGGEGVDGVALEKTGT